MNLNQPARPKPPKKFLYDNDRSLLSVPADGLLLTDVINAVNEAGLPFETIKFGKDDWYTSVIIMGKTVPNPNYETELPAYYEALEQYDADMATLRANKELWLQQQIDQIKSSAEEKIQKIKEKYEDSKNKQLLEEERKMAEAAKNL